MKIDAKDLCRAFNLTRHRKHAVLDQVNLSFEPGSFTAILGESGCGKSTLLNLLSGLSLPTSGRILADGKPVLGPSPDRSLLFQQASLLPWLTIADNIVFGCRLRGELANLDERLAALMRLIGLVGYENRYPVELSVGMAQRVCLARALIGQPKALLLDEPFGALDIFNRIRLQNELIQIWQLTPFTGILVTHDIDESLIVAQKIIILGGSPTTVQSLYTVDLPYPRDIATLAFFEARRQVLQQLRDATSGVTPP